MATPNERPYDCLFNFQEVTQVNINNFTSIHSPTTYLIKKRFTDWKKYPSTLLTNFRVNSYRGGIFDISGDMKTVLEASAFTCNSFEYPNRLLESEHLEVATTTFEVLQNLLN